jgi:hypothetical protein
MCSLSKGVRFMLGFNLLQDIKNNPDKRDELIAKAN